MTDILQPNREIALERFIATMQQRVQTYLNARNDSLEQFDHLRHVADRARWLYFSELQRQGDKRSINRYESAIIDACVLTHDFGKWVPRDHLRNLIPSALAPRQALFDQLGFTPFQAEVFLLATQRRLALPKDGYTTEYDAAHHLVSAFCIVADRDLGFAHLPEDDQQRLINMIIGHHFGGYFKERLLNLALRDDAITGGMISDLTRPERIVGDTLACAFHDADLSDLLYVGNLERRPNREDILHVGGLVKILLINLNNIIFAVPDSPADVLGCISSCQFTVNNVCQEFITPTAIEMGVEWRAGAGRFLNRLKERESIRSLTQALGTSDLSVAERLNAVRLQAYWRARDFINVAQFVR